MGSSCPTSNQRNANDHWRFQRSEPHALFGSNGQPLTRSSSGKPAFIAQNHPGRGDPAWRVLVFPGIHGGDDRDALLIAFVYTRRVAGATDARELDQRAGSV
jgi:hypothetical protein